MKTDALKQFITLRESLLKEKAALETRLAQINKALDLETSPVPSAKQAGKKSVKIVNPMSLKEAITRATSAKPLAKKEILNAIQKLGYRFATDDPMKSINVVLYSKRHFKNENGKFSPK